ncbi:MAG: hypothetical protein MMC33_005107 [Icmadophila ericetorum]|nr:hypothetical protein [Icmadophila ericetorum]
MEGYSFEDESATSSESLIEKESKTWAATQKPSRRSWIVPLSIHLSVLSLYTVAFFWSLHYLREQFVHDPVRPAINFELQEFDHTQIFFNHTAKPYGGAPKPEIDDAWDDLLRGFNMRVTEDEMRQLGKLDNNIPLPDGGYFGSLTVFHQLHCIWRLHTALYPKYYWADLSDEEAFLNLGHSEHCLDVMRQSLLCNADTSIITMKWGNFQASPLADASNKHECVNWAGIMEWLEPRVINPFQENYLVHPKFGKSSLSIRFLHATAKPERNTIAKKLSGPAFADERGGKIGVAVEGKDKHFDAAKIQEILKYTGR